MKRILLLTLEFPPAVGGAQHYFFEIARRCRSIELHVCAPLWPDSKEVDALFPGRIHRRRLVSSAIWPSWLPFLWHVFQLQRVHHFEAIWAGQLLPSGLCAFFISRLFRIPYVLHANGMEVAPAWTPGIRGWLGNLTIKHSRHFTTISAFTQHLLVMRGAVSDRITFVRPCPSMRAVSSAPDDQEILRLRVAFREKYGLYNQPVILSVNRLVHRKGLDLVIRAISQLRVTVPTIRAFIVGEGPERLALQRLIDELHLAKIVSLTGAVSDEDLPLYYAGCDIFVLTPRELPNGDVEGFGIVYLEANLFGRPVIGTRSGGVPDAVKEGVSGLLVTPDHVDELHTAIKELLTTPSRAQQLGKQGRERCANEFNWDLQVNHFEKLWNKIL